MKVKVTWATLAVINVFNVVYLGFVINYFLFSGLLEPSMGNTVAGMTTALICVLTFVLSAIVAGRVSGRIGGEYRWTSRLIAGAIVMITMVWVLLNISLIIYLPFTAILLFLNSRFIPPETNRYPQ